MFKSMRNKLQQTMINIVDTHTFALANAFVLVHCFACTAFVLQAVPWVDTGRVSVCSVRELIRKPACERDIFHVATISLRVFFI